MSRFAEPDLNREPPVIVPNRWQGETDCFVGPFSSQTVAEYFANTVVDFGQFEGFSQKIVVRRDAYYVQVLETSR